MATNISGLPSTGYTNTSIARITKMALQRAATDPIINRFMKNDASFDRDLEQSFDRGDVANIVIAPKLTGSLSTDISDTVTYQTATFNRVQLSLDSIAYVAFQHRDINQSVSDINLRETLADSAGITLVETMYEEIVRDLTNNANIGTDQNVGTVGTTTGVYRSLQRTRTLAEAQFKIKRTERMVAILNPYSYEDLLQDSAFQYQISADETTVRTGVISNVLNMEIYSDPSLSNTGGASNSISGSAGAVGLVFVPESGVIATRQLTLSDPSRQFRANYQGLSALYTSTYDASSVGGLNVQDKLEIMFGFQTLPVYRYSDNNYRAKVFRILGGIA